MSASVAVTPSCGGELRLELGVDDPLEGDAGELLLLLVEDPELRLRLGLGQVTGLRLGADAALGLADPPALDRVPVDELVLGDRLAIDAPDRSEVVVVPGQRGRDDEDDDGDDDHEAEAEVHVEAASVAALPGWSLGPLGDGFGSECHVS